jgi:hypothetical protein
VKQKALSPFASGIAHILDIITTREYPNNWRDLTLFYGAQLILKIAKTKYEWPASESFMLLVTCLNEQLHRRNNPIQATSYRCLFTNALKCAWGWGILALKRTNEWWADDFMGKYIPNPHDLQEAIKVYLLRRPSWTHPDPHTRAQHLLAWYQQRNSTKTPI